MAKARNSLERMARRIDLARAAGEQLSLLPDEAGRTPQDVGGAAQIGRPKGAVGKGSSQLRRWLAERGFRMPEEQLAQMAGLAGGADPMLAAMTRAEQVLAWSHNGGEVSGEQRLGVFLQLYAIQLRAADALLPYGTPKAAPDVAVQQNVQVVMPSAPEPAAAPVQAPAGPVLAGRMVPADVAYEMTQKQALSEAEDPASDAEGRTE